MSHIERMASRALWPTLALALLAACQVTEPGLPAPSVAATAPHTSADIEGLWVVQMRRDHWSPRHVDFLVRFDSSQGHWVGSLVKDPVFGVGGTYPISSVDASGELLRFSFHDSTLGTFIFEGDRAGDTAEGTVAWNDGTRDQLGSFVSHRRSVRRFDPHNPDHALPVELNPARAGLDPLWLDRLLLAAEHARSDALVVVADGKVVCERYFGRAPSTMSLQSITKAISSLSLAYLLQEGKIESVDVPMSRWYPELGEHGRADISLRHVLTHTTGLEPGDTAELNRAPDRLAHSRSAALVHRPGTKFEYSNRAMNLVGGVVEAEAGVGVDTFLRQRLFGPLGITEVEWPGDSSGRSATYAGLALGALDLALIGQVLADGGVWQGRQIVPAPWITQMAQPASDVQADRGLAWSLRPTSVHNDGTTMGFAHSGSGGQFLFVYPSARLVVVRLTMAGADNTWDAPNKRRDGFSEIANLADLMATDMLHRRRTAVPNP
jgi:CubicO group peptidase (beta-lactamase class C family)